MADHWFDDSDLSDSGDETPGCFCSSPGKSSISLDNEPFPYEYHLHSVCALAVKCQHNAMPVALIKTKNVQVGALWLPYISTKKCFNSVRTTDKLTELFYKELGYVVFTVLINCPTVFL